jgi:hypothetical protein
MSNLIQSKTRRDRLRWASLAKKAAADVPIEGAGSEPYFLARKIGVAGCIARRAVTIQFYNLAGRMFAVAPNNTESARMIGNEIIRIADAIDAIASGVDNEKRKEN